jgi:hypothetical protein
MDPDPKKIIQDPQHCRKLIVLIVVILVGIEICSNGKTPTGKTRKPGHCPKMS